MIIVQQRGRLANRMFQYMLARRLQALCGQNVPIAGCQLPQWGIKTQAPPVHQASQQAWLVLDQHKFELDKVAFALTQGLVDHVTIKGWGMRLEYFPDPAGCSQLFTNAGVDFYRPAASEILLHVRGGDIVTGFHAQYFPMPLAYYQQVIDQSGLEPVFIGQIYEGEYAQVLRDYFPQAKFLPPASPVADFQTIRHAPHVALSVSSFCWLAAWLSQVKQTVHMPVCGMFTPTWGDAMLLPAGDPHYRFYNVPFPTMAQRSGLDLGRWVGLAHDIAPISRDRALAMARHACFRRPNGANAATPIGSKPRN